MELKTTEEFVREAHDAACSTWKQRIEKEFPELFKTELKVGKWYVLKSYLFDWLMNYQGDGDLSYGFNTRKNWSNYYFMHGCDDWKEATPEQVSEALIAEAKKRGYVGKNIIMIEGLKGLPSYHIMSGKFSFEVGQNQLICDCGEYGKYTIFHDGIWAEILPEEKTIITHEKALKIIAKKLKVSPESIEIK